MSIKIYNGIKFKSNSFKEILDQLVSVSKLAIPIANSLIKKDDLEMFIIGNKLIEKDEFDIAMHIKDAICSPNIGKYAFTPNISFSIIVYPTFEGDVYGYYFDSNKKEYNSLLKPYYTDFHYQDQSDKPDNLTNEEWNFRYEKWQELLSFDDVGFKYDIVSVDHIDFHSLRMKIKDILSYLVRDQQIKNVIDK